MLYKILAVAYMNPIRRILIQPSVSYTAATNAICSSAKTIIIIIISITITIKSIDCYVANKRNT
jgi:hypothetical protein